jgi:heme-degrading monooxygenase HmoA
MYARVWRLVVLPEKGEEFAAAVTSVLPVLRKQPGFRGCLVLRGGPGEKLEATVVSAWDSLVDLRNSETPAFQKALVHVLSFCERRPFMREEEVLVSEFASQSLNDTATNF